MNWTRPGIVDFQQIGNEEIGFISVAEVKKQVDFPMKRVYWVYGTPNDVQRGNQANIENKQILVLLKGLVEITLTGTDGKVSKYSLHNPNQGLFIPNLHWRQIDFIEDSVLLSLCSHQFKEKDYIRDFDKFLAL